VGQGTEVWVSIRVIGLNCGVEAQVRDFPSDHMATGKFRGWIWCNDGTSADPTGYFYNQGGLAATGSNSISVTGLYLWRGVTEWCVQLKFQTGGSNVKQGGWSTFDTSTSGARGTRGDAFGTFEIELGGFSYLFLPSRVFGYYDGSTTVTLFITSPAPRIA